MEIKTIIKLVTKPIWYPPMLFLKELRGIYEHASKCLVESLKGDGLDIWVTFVTLAVTSFVIALMINSMMVVIVSILAFLTYLVIYYMREYYKE